MKQLREILIEFGQTTTVHGFSQLINSKGIIHRLFWITLIIGCKGYILMNMKKLVEYYQKKFISTNVYFKSNASPAFPVVVLCNANIIRKDAMDKILKEIEKMNRRKGRNTRATISLATITELQLEIYNEIFKYGTNFDDFLFVTNYSTQGTAERKSIGTKYGTHCMAPALFLKKIFIKMELQKAL